MPGNFRFSVDMLLRELEEVVSLEIPAVILFGIPEHKDELGSEGIAEEGIIQQAVREIKKSIPGLIIITDVCFCGYTSHGHCGCIKEHDVDNDTTLGWLAT